jgi:hypothetical protein
VDVGGPVTSKSDPNAGILTLENGKSVAILPKDLNFTGHAAYRWPNGREQAGNWVGGKLSGMGTEKTANAEYTGQWKEGLRHGHGELATADGNRYLGSFKDGSRDGEGTETTTLGTYKGSWANDRRHGQGQFIGNDGGSYQGQWFAGTRSGLGRAITANGDRYEGDWRDDVPHGFGTRVFADGSVYTGEWSSGEREGYGKLTTVSTEIYEGTWVGDTRNGFGRQQRPDKSYYEGEWRNGKKHGDGSEVFADGRRHDGTWEDGYLLGLGTRTHGSGITISGPWIRNSISQGLLTLPSGLEFAGPLFAANGSAVSKDLVNWLTQKASLGDPHAQLYLASAYLDFDEPPPDPKTAEIWLEKSAEAGISEAEFRLAILLIDEDPDRHLSLLQSAANDGHPRAHELLGEFYHIGKYVEQSLEAAANHYEKAITKGSIAAANNLAWLLATTRDGEVADADRAIELIQPIVLYYGNWQHLDTLAAAHARVGNLDLATRMQRQALIQAKSFAADDLVAELEARLDLYVSGQAYIE